MRLILRIQLGAACSLLAACYSGRAQDEGGADEPGDTSAASSGAETGVTGDTGDTGEEPATPQVPAPTIRRLTEAEFRHSVQDLLGPVTLSAVEADAAQDGFFAVGAARVALSPAGVAQYEAALGDATVEAFVDPVALEQDP